MWHAHTSSSTVLVGFVLCLIGSGSWRHSVDRHRLSMQEESQCDRYCSVDNTSMIDSFFFRIIVLLHSLLAEDTGGAAILPCNRTVTAPYFAVQ